MQNPDPSTAEVVGSSQLPHNMQTMNLQPLEDAILHLEALRASSSYAAEEASSLSTASGRQKYLKLVHAMSEGMQKLRRSWPAVAPILAAAAVKREDRPESIEAAIPYSLSRRSWQSRCQAISVQLEQSVDQALLDCRASKRRKTVIDSALQPLLPHQSAKMKDLKELIAVMERVRAVQAGIFIFSIASNGAVCDPYKTMPVELRVLCPKVFAASISLERPGMASACRVCIDSAGKAAELDPWSTPSLQVFRRLTALSSRVLAYYSKRAPACLATASTPLLNTHPSSVALEDMLLWLATYKDIFSRRCAATGRLLAWDPSVQYPIPPILRPFQLPRSELRALAADPSRVTAYHMHAAPAHLLGWSEDLRAAAAVVEHEVAVNTA